MFLPKEHRKHLKFFHKQKKSKPACILAPGCATFDIYVYYYDEMYDAFLKKIANRHVKPKIKYDTCH